MELYRAPIYQQIYDHLLTRIIAGELVPGMRLTEEKIAAELGISRTPVRESLIRLEQEGFLRQRTVIEPSPKEIKESYEVRMLLEGHAARLAAEVWEDEKKHRLAAIVDQAKSNDFEQRMAANTGFHDAIVEACGNDHIIDIIKKHQTLILFCRQHVIKTREALCCEHVQLLEAIQKGDGDLAERLMRLHLKNNMNDFIDHFDA